MNFTKILIAILTVFTLSLQAKDIKLTETSNQFVITNKSLSEFTFVSHLSDINPLKVKTDIGEFAKIAVESGTKKELNLNFFIKSSSDV